MTLKNFTWVLNTSNHSIFFFSGLGGLKSSIMHTYIYVTETSYTFRIGKDLKWNVHKDLLCDGSFQAPGYRTFHSMALKSDRPV